MVALGLVLVGSFVGFNGCLIWCCFVLVLIVCCSYLLFW